MGLIMRRGIPFGSVTIPISVNENEIPKGNGNGWVTSSEFYLNTQEDEKSINTTFDNVTQKIVLRGEYNSENDSFSSELELSGNAKAKFINASNTEIKDAASIALSGQSNLTMNALAETKVLDLSHLNLQGNADIRFRGNNAPSSTLTQTEFFALPGSHFLIQGNYDSTTPYNNREGVGLLATPQQFAYMGHLPTQFSQTDENNPTTDQSWGLLGTRVSPALSKWNELFDTPTPTQKLTGHYEHFSPWLTHNTTFLYEGSTVFDIGDNEAGLTYVNIKPMQNSVLYVNMTPGTSSNSQITFGGQQGSQLWLDITPEKNASERIKLGGGESSMMDIYVGGGKNSSLNFQMSPDQGGKAEWILNGTNLFHQEHEYTHFEMGGMATFIMSSEPYGREGHLNKVWKSPMDTMATSPIFQLHNGAMIYMRGALDVSATAVHPVAAGNNPVLEIVDKSELRICDNCKLTMMEDSNNEIKVTFSDGTNDVSFTIAELQALKALLS